MVDKFQDPQLFAHVVRALRQTGSPRTFRRAEAFRAVRADRSGRADRGAGAVKREELEQ